jgi:hypothetical protein
MKILRVGAELFRADGQTDMTKLINAFRNSGNAPKRYEEDIQHTTVLSTTGQLYSNNLSMLLVTFLVHPVISHSVHALANGLIPYRLPAGEINWSLLWTFETGHLEHSSLLFDRQQRIFPRGKTGKRYEDDHSTPSCSKVKNWWSYTSTPTHAFMACTGTTFLALFPLYSDHLSNINSEFFDAKF